VTESQQKKIPIVWTVSASVSGGGGGIQADLHTFHDFKVHGCTVVTALIAENSFAQGHSVATERKNVVAQINALDSDMPADVIKLGVLPSFEVVETVTKYIVDYDGFVIYDLELESSGESLLAESADLLKSTLLPRVDLLVVNIEEANALLETKIEGPESIEAAAQALMAMGVRSVIITGAHFSFAPNQRFDYWLNAADSIWITINKLDTVNNRGGGCTLSAALAAAVACGEKVESAITLAKAYVSQGIRGAIPVGSGPGAVAHLGWPENQDDLPILSTLRPQS
jgi:hydroxymethylpyrimidine kinase/phosphomethylpyrimidine kinase/thiamine-phosphate diphosphorylase